MKKKTVYAPVRLTTDDEERLKALMKWGDMERSDAIRFSLSFTHIMMTIIPAAIIETILDEQLIDE